MTLQPLWTFGCFFSFLIYTQSVDSLDGGSARFKVATYTLSDTNTEWTDIDIHHSSEIRTQNAKTFHALDRADTVVGRPSFCRKIILQIFLVKWTQLFAIYLRIFREKVLPPCSWQMIKGCVKKMYGYRESECRYRSPDQSNRSKEKSERIWDRYEGYFPGFVSVLYWCCGFTFGLRNC
jgi:hypothetical protein